MALTLTREQIAKEEQRRAVAEADRLRPPATGVERTERDFKSAATGLRETAEGTAGLGGDLPGMAGGTAKWIMEHTAGQFPNFTGATPEKSAEFGKTVEGATETGVKAASGQYGLGYIIKRALEEAGIIEPGTANENILPTSQEVHGAVSDVLPEGVDKATSYEPTNMEESLFQFGGNMAPGMGGKVQGAKRGADIVKALIQRLGTRVALPAGAQEATTQGTDYLIEQGHITPETATAIKVLVGAGSGMGAGMLERSSAIKQAASTVGADPAAIRVVYDAVRADGYDEAGAIARLDEMGIDSRLLDLGPSSRNQGRVAQSAPTEGRKEMHQFLEDRATREPLMTKGIREEAFGPEVNRNVVKKELKTRENTETAEYGPAHARQAAPVDAQTMIDEIDTLLGGEKSPKKRQHLEDIKKSLYIQDKHGTVTGTVDPSSSGLLSARQALRDKLYDVHGNKRMDLGPAEAEMLGDMYTRINQEMDVANPDIRAIDEKVSGIKEEGRKFDEGADVLKRGEDAQSGSEFDPIYKAMKPEQQAKIKQGVSRWIDGQVDMSSTDKAKLKSIVGTTWNKQKLETMIGPEKTAKLLQGLDTIDEFRQSHKIIKERANIEQPNQRPVTEGTLEAGAITAGTSGSLEAGLATAAATMGRNWLRNKLAGSMVPDTVKSDMAKLLVSKEPRDVLKAAMLLKSADKQSAMPQAMMQALVARFAEGHR